MADLEYLDEPVLVTTKSAPDARLAPQLVVWRGRHFPIVTVGRQWEEETGRHVLVEANDGTRFELQLGRDNVSWRIKRVWWGQIMV